MPHPSRLSRPILAANVRAFIAMTGGKTGANHPTIEWS